MAEARPTYRLAGWIGSGPATAEALAAFLGRHQGRDVDVIVNSPGGDALEGAALLAEAEAHARVRFRVRGIAASSASLLLCGGREVLIHPAAFWMAHRPWSIVAGDADELRAEAALLDKVGRTDAEVYARFSGQPVERVASWLAEETWLTAEEAVALGFADAIDADAEPEAPVPADYASFTAAPAALQRLAREAGWAESQENERGSSMKTERKSSALGAHQPGAGRGALARLRSPRPPSAGQGSAPASAAPSAGQGTAPGTTPEAPPARLMAQLRQLARSRGLPDEMADRLAARPGMSLRRAEALAPGLEVIRDLSERQRLGAEDLDRAVREYVAQVEQAGDAEGGDGGEPDAARVQEVARDVVFAAAADADVREIGPTREVSVGVDWDRGPGLRARLVDGLQARLDRAHEPRMGREFADASLSDLCMAIARGRGERVSGRREAVRMVTGGAHTSSDFALITADAMSNVLARQFAQRQPDLARASREIPRESYHEGHALTLSASGMPQEVLEGAEIQFTTMAEGGEALPAPRDFASGFNLTNRAIVNDRVDLLSQAGERMVRGAIERLRRVLLEPLEANGGAGQTMRDGSPVFDAARGNVAGTGGALSLDTLAAARVALRKATGLQGELYAVEPFALVVPAELETVAQQLVADLAATRFEDANPFSGALDVIVEPGLADPAAWYLIGNPAVHDGLAHAFLDGQSAPRVESRPAWETLGVQYRLVWAVDAKFVETASWFRNPGA